MSTRGAGPAGAFRMNVIVTGGRHYVLTPADYQYLEHAVATLRARQLLTSGARGAEAAAERWALRRGLEVQRLTPDWRRDGTAAGTRSHFRLMTAARAVVAFPGGARTAELVRQARARLLPVHQSPSRHLAHLSAAADAGSSRRTGPRISL